MRLTDAVLLFRDRGVNLEPEREFPMSMRTISPLRQSMMDEMTARQMGPKTQKDYIRSCKRFTIFLGRSPDAAIAD
jgi:hypothetical protein